MVTLAGPCSRRPNAAGRHLHPLGIVGRLKRVKALKGTFLIGGSYVRSENAIAESLHQKARRQTGPTNVADQESAKARRRLSPLDCCLI